MDVKSPVTRRGPQYFDFCDQTVIYAEPRAENIWVSLVRNDHFRERLACRGVQQAAVMFDLHGRLNQTVVDVRHLEVLDITQPLCEGQAGNVALGLSGKI